MKNLILLSVFSGLLIGLGDIVFIETFGLSKVLGSFLFSLGLFGVVTQGGYLYTGKIGYLGKPKTLAIGLGCNLIAIYLMCWIWSWCTSSEAEFIEPKIAEGFGVALARGIGCGMCMFLAVDTWKKLRNPLCIILPVMLFILAGFDHCVANMGYLGFAHTLSWNMIPWILGNTLGSWILAGLCGTWTKKSQD